LATAGVAPVAGAEAAPLEGTRDISQAANPKTQRPKIHNFEQLVIPELLPERTGAFYRRERLFIHCATPRPARPLVFEANFI
jgi:hypothetical protein